MPLVTTAELVGDAGSRGRGIAAFNVITLEHAEGIVAGAQRSGRPVILQVSENTVKFHDGQMRPLAAALTALASEAAVPVACISTTPRPQPCGTRPRWPATPR